MKNRFVVTLIFVFLGFNFMAQRHNEVGVEIQAASFSNLGGSVGGALKFAIVEDETVAFGPSLRYQYFWSNNAFTGINTNASTVGGGGFLHYRFLDWFYAGTEVEILRNPFNNIDPSKKWTVTGFVGAGVSREWEWVRFNFGMLFDVVDALKDPLASNPSPLRRDYFIRRQNPNTLEAQGAYLPIIYRITFFFPIN